VIDERFLVWLAGFFDGEGCVGLYLRGNDFTCKASIINTERPVLEEIAAMFGGSLTARKVVPGRKPVFALQLNGATAETLLRAIRPFTKVKSAQIDVFLEARALLLPPNETSFVQRLTPGDHAQRRELAAECRRLKAVA
jgi:hypothetical protein